MSTFTRGATVIVLPDVLATDHSASVPTTVHELLNGGVAFTLHSALPTTGTLELLTESRTEAVALDTFLRGVGPIVYADSDVPAASMTFVVTGSVGFRPDANTDAWVITADYTKSA